MRALRNVLDPSGKLDSRLRIASITPSVEVLAEFDKGLGPNSAALRQRRIREKLGKIKVLKNEFDKPTPPPSPAR